MNISRLPVCLSLCFMLLAGHIWCEDEKELPKTVSGQLDQIIATYQNDNLIRLVNQIAPLLKRMDTDRQAAADSYLQGKGIPKLGEMVVDARFRLQESHYRGALPKPSFREAMAVSKELHDRIRFAERAFASNRVSEKPLPRVDKLDDYELLIWDLHVLRNQFTNAVKYSRAAKQFLQPFARRIEKEKADFSDDQLKIAETDFTRLTERLNKRLNDINEIEAIFRIYRLEDASAVLSKSTVLRDQLAAAFALEFDMRILENFLTQNANRLETLSREDLRDPNLLDSLRAMTNRVRKENADVIRKAELLYVGMHWWYRGRYGAGPLVRGLLKSPNATRSEEALFPLYMPIRLPRPADPYLESRPALRYERRHHYNWAVEYRPVQSRVSRHSQVTGQTKRPTSRYFY